jgi:chromosome segregation ATPase
MFKSQEIADLQGRIAALETDLKTAGDASAKLQGELDKTKAELTKAESQVSTHAATITELNGKVTTAEAARIAAEEKATKAEASINDQVTTRLAAAGVDPVKRDPAAADKTGDGQPAASGLKGIEKARAALAAKQTK